MIPTREIKEIARANGVPVTTIERDYVQNWLLIHLSKMNFVLKGGTGIKKIYFKDYRFSDDLDFSLVKDIDLEELHKTIKSTVVNAKEESGINFIEDIKLNKNINGFEGIIYFRILSSSGSPLKTKLDMTESNKEIIIMDVQKRKLIHPYSDSCQAEIHTYALEEITAEKIRALFERTRPRDLYDVSFLVNIIDEDKILNLLPEKFKFKGVNIEIESLVNRRDDFVAAWQTSLNKQLRNVPDFDNTFNEVLNTIENFKKKLRDLIFSNT